jgi:hypothetical protein
MVTSISGALAREGGRVAVTITAATLSVSVSSRVDAQALE